jgi:hypothetical protein
MTLVCRMVPLMALGLLVGAGCSSTTTVEDAGSTGTSTGGSTTGGTTTGGSSTGGSTTGGSTSGGTSGGGPNLTCNGVALPTTAPAMVNLSGTVEKTDLTGMSGVAGATVEFFASSGGSALATTTTDSTGAFSVTVPTGGVPLAGYFHASAATFVDTYWYPPTPFYQDSTNVPISLLTPATIGQLEYFSGMVTHTPGLGRIGMDVFDCAGHPIAGAVVSSNPAPGKITYVVAGFPSTTATATDPSGTAFMHNVPAGQVTLNATVGATTLRANPIEVRGDVVTEASVVP